VIQPTLPSRRGTTIESIGKLFKRAICNAPASSTVHEYSLRYLMVRFCVEMPSILHEGRFSGNFTRDIFQETSSRL
jgi:hypothetical protein